MTQKKYQVLRLVITVILSASISASIVIENYYLPVIMVLSAFAAIYYIKSRYRPNVVTADERDYKVAGDAARYTLFAYSWIGAIGTFVLMAISGKKGTLYSLSLYLAFSVCFLMLANAGLFKYLIKRGK